MLRIALSLVVWLAGASVASACSFAHEPDFEIDESIEDGESPVAAVVKEVRITRGKGPTRGRGLVLYDSCDDLGTISIEIDTDDPAVGYFLARADGSLPSGLTLPEAARPARGLSLRWIDGATDHQDAFAFALTIRSVDRAGNLGESIEILIEDDGMR